MPPSTSVKPYHLRKPNHISSCLLHSPPFNFSHLFLQVCILNVSILNNKGLNEHPCLTSLAVQSLSPNFLSTLYFLFSTTFLLPLFLSVPPLSPLVFLKVFTNNPLSTESNAAFKSTNNAISFLLFSLTIY